MHIELEKGRPNVPSRKSPNAIQKSFVSLLGEQITITGAFFLFHSYVCKKGKSYTRGYIHTCSFLQGVFRSIAAVRMYVWLVFRDRRRRRQKSCLCVLGTRKE